MKKDSKKNENNYQIIKIYDKEINILNSMEEEKLEKFIFEVKTELEFEKNKTNNAHAKNTYKYPNYIFPSINAYNKFSDILKNYHMYLFSTNHRKSIKKLKNQQRIECITYNPFHYINNGNNYDSSDMDMEIVKFANVLLSPFEKGNDRHNEFGKQFNILLSALLAYLYHYCKSDLQTLGNVTRLLRMFDIDENDKYTKNDIDRLFDEVEKDDPDSYAVIQYKVFKLNSPEIQRYIAANLATFLSEFNINNINTLTSTNTIPLESIANEENIALIVDIDKDITPCTHVIFWNTMNSIINEAFEKGVEGNDCS